MGTEEFRGSTDGINSLRAALEEKKKHVQELVQANKTLRLALGNGESQLNQHILA